MILKELFRSVEFDDILPIIIKYDPGIRGSEAGLKQAFDSVRLVIPIEEESCEIIKVKYFNDNDASEGYSVSNCSNTSFRKSAGKRVETAPNLNLTKEELAAYCLWELTYWGYSDEESSDKFRIEALGRWGSPQNRFEEEYAEKSSKWFLAAPVPKNFFDEHKNRAKRKRDYRHNRRLKQLYRYAKIEELCQYVNYYNVNGVSEDDLWRLKDVAGFKVYTDRSYSDTDAMAEQYMCELYDKYYSANRDAISSIAIITGGSAVRGELDRLKESIANKFPNVIIGIGERTQAQITVKIVEVI